MVLGSRLGLQATQVSETPTLRRERDTLPPAGYVGDLRPRRRNDHPWWTQRSHLLRSVKLVGGRRASDPARLLGISVSHRICCGAGSKGFEYQY
jgi:hypothetical protein